MFFESLRKFWNKYDFLIIIGVSFVLLILFGIYNKLFGKKGTWNDHFYSPPSLHEPKSFSTSPQQRLFDSKGEIECRRILKKIFQKPFSKIRPQFLNNVVTGGLHNLEIDCYDEDLRLGVEYQGKQHYEFTPYFHKNKEAFYNQKYRDELKRRMCKDNRITLIEVPYYVKTHEIEVYLMKQLQKYGYT
jgi:hypothetical protein